MLQRSLAQSEEDEEKLDAAGAQLRGQVRRKKAVQQRCPVKIALGNKPSACGWPGTLWRLLLQARERELREIYSSAAKNPWERGGETPPHRKGPALS